MGDVRVQVRLEGLEVRPRPSAEELVPDMAEHLLCRDFGMDCALGWAGLLKRV